MVDMTMIPGARMPNALIATATNTIWLNPRSLWLMGVVLAILAGAYIVGMFLRKPRCTASVSRWFPMDLTSSTTPLCVSSSRPLSGEV